MIMQDDSPLDRSGFETKPPNEIEISGAQNADDWKRNLRREIRKANPGDVLIVHSGLQKATALAVVSEMGADLLVVKRP